MCHSIFIKHKSFWQIFSCLSLIIMFVSWLYAPFVSEGIPYFYDEDEGHHFDRVVEMVKEGSFNPKYFLKPSLHFYLRMPVTAMAFLHIAKKGEIKSVQDIRTKDNFGLAGRSFTASHPFIMKANRIFSLSLTLASLVFVFLIALQLKDSLLFASFATLLTSFSPTLAGRSAFIGVDGPTLFFALLTIYLALLLQKKPNFTLLCSCTLTAGLTISTKYNAAPIYFVPMIAYLLSNEKKAFEIVLALFLPILGFFLASPYILVSIPLFLDHVAYEMWHYKTGHIGHMAEPGIEQALFYLNWLWQDGWHIIPFLALAGFIFICKTTEKKLALITAVFPVIYCCLMLSQRVNFTRNLIIILPFLATYSTYAVMTLFHKVKINKTFLYLFLFAIISIYPFILTLNARANVANSNETRNEVYNWLLENSPKEGLNEIAISGKLGLHQFTATINRETKTTLHGVTRIDPATSLFELYLSGFDKIVLGPERTLTPQEEEITKTIKVFSGNKEISRIYKNPEIRVLEFIPNISSTPAFNDYMTEHLPVIRLNPISDESSQNKEENVIWMQKRVNNLEISNVYSSKINIPVYTPWNDMELTFYTDGRTFSCLAKQNTWSDCTLSGVNNKNGHINLKLFVPNIHSPKNQGGSSDERRLGIAIK